MGTYLYNKYIWWDSNFVIFNFKDDFGFWFGIVDVRCFFYTTHKILHINPFYKWFHKKHHELTAPIGFSALYMTVFDMYFANILPLYLPLVLLSAHPYTIMIWMIIININTVIVSHGGIKWLSDFHDNHHKCFNVNFGLNMIMDYLFDYR